MNRIIPSAFVALAALAVPVMASAQQTSAAPRAAAPAPAQQAGPTAEQQAWLNELQQIGGKLQTAQVKALEDPALRSSQEALGTEIKTAMEKKDPGLAGVAQRVQTMEAEARKAQENGDAAKLQQLTQEAQQIEARFVKAQTEALQDSALAAKAQAFEQRLESKVLEIEPNARQLLARGQELQQKLAASMQQARPGGR
ncbi:MAG: hypothetical protein M3409_03840 [Gemmatimonadota bacterium]|nr:hypothetical protein [Gemmatimonadota bacterium]